MISFALIIIGVAMLPLLLFLFAVDCWLANDRGMAVFIGLGGIGVSALIAAGVLAAAGY